MNKKYTLICISLLVSLFIYLFYRTDRTVVNQILIQIISFKTYTLLKSNIVKFVPLNSIVIYSLPEGLWIFCITLTSKPYYIRLYQLRIYCLFIPIVSCVLLEILQLLHFANGRFDFMDIGVSFVFWILGVFLCKASEKQDIIEKSGLKMIICLASYSIVYLAHVLK